MPDRRALLLAASAALGLATFAVLALAVVREGAVVDLDARVSRRVAQSMPRFVEWLALAPTWIGGLVGLTLVSLTAALVLLARGRALDAVWLVVAIAAVQLLVSVVKTGFDRERPADGAAIPLPSSSAFPSGHAAAGLVAAGALAVVFGTGHRPLRVWAAAALAGLLIGVSRVVLNVHYVSDVVAGFGLGLAFLAIALLVRDAVRRWRTP